MLSRLAGDHPLEPLATLADVLEPVRFYARTRIRTYQTDTPLNRLVDAVRPESLVARHFAALRNEDEIRTWLELWQGNHSRLKPLLADSLPLREVAPLSEDLSRLASVGLEALLFLERHERAPAAWVSQARQELESAAGPDFTVSMHMEATGSWPAPGTWWSDRKTSRKRAELEIMVVPAIARLVERAASQ
jgi:hexosaminidase